MWKQNNNKWDPITTLTSHKESVTNVAVLVDKETKTCYIASTSTDGTVIIHRRETIGTNTMNNLTRLGAEWTVDGKLSFGNKMMEAVGISFLPNSKVVCVATGGLDFLIHLFVKHEANQYKKACSVAGHQDWIRSLRFVTCDDGNVLLASAAQDTKVRLWRFKPSTGSEQVVMDVDISALYVRNYLL